MNMEVLEHSARDLLASVVADGQWLPALEGMMARMDVLGGGIARIVPPRMYAIPTSGVAGPFQDLLEGRTPTLTNSTPLRPRHEQGFIADHVAIPEDVRARDQFYQEFLRPNGLVYKTGALLDANGGGSVDAIVYRTERQGPFEIEDLRTLGVMLPYMRAAAMLARASLTTMAARQAEPFERRGEPVVRLKADGRIAEMNAAAERACGRLFGTVDRRVVTIASGDRARLDRIISGTLSDDRPGLATLASLGESGRVMVLAVPVLGHARDLFQSVCALLVFLESGRRYTVDGRTLHLLKEAAGLTRREADMVREVAAGHTPREAAANLGIAYETARLHLKSAFARLGVHTQAELASLVARLG